MMRNFWKGFNRLASPKAFYHFAGRILPWVWVIAILFLAYGLINGLVFAPADYQQGDAYRIIYINVPTAILSLLIFVAIAIWSAMFLIWRVKIADILVKASATVGVWMTFCALVVGSLWGKPMWGTYWIWDARLTSELILLFLYLGIILLRQAIPNQDKAAKASAIVSIVGVVNVPIIHNSVNWWNTLHQKDTLHFFSHSTIAPSMLHPLIAAMIGFLFFSIAVGLMNVRAEILYRENQTAWVK